MSFQPGPDGELPDHIAEQFELEEKPKRKTGLVPFWQRSVQVPMLFVLILIFLVGLLIFQPMRQSSAPPAIITPVVISTSISVTSVTTSSSVVISSSGSSLMAVFSPCTTRPPETGFMVMAANPSRAGAQLIRADLDGNNMCALTQIGSGDPDLPDISPDGQTIAFTEDNNLRVIDTLGGPRSSIDDPLNLANPVWSPDGKSLLVSGWKGESGNPVLYTLPTDKLPAPLTPLRSDGNGTAEFAAAWSPDGTQIAFALQEPSDIDIYVINSDGTSVRRLTDERMLETDPAWSPDGKQLVFATYTAETGNGLAIINADGTGLTRILESATSLTSPVWTPNYIYFVGPDEATGQFAVHRIRPDGTGREQVTLPINVTAVDVWMPKQE